MKTSMKTSMKKNILLFISAFLFSFAAVNVSAADFQVRIATEGTYPPFNFKDEKGELQGFDVDIAREIAKRIGAKPTFILQDWDGLIPGLLSNKFDLIIASMSITEERQMKMDFSKPYRGSTARFVARKGANIIPFDASGKPNPQALQGKTVGVQRGSMHDIYLENEFKGLQQINRYAKPDEAILDLQAGRVDLVLNGPIKLYQSFLVTAAGQDYEFVGPELVAQKYFGTGVGVGLRKGNEELLAKINKALDEMIADGTFESINKKYWNFSVLPGAWQSK